MTRLSHRMFSGARTECSSSASTTRPSRQGGPGISRRNSERLRPTSASDEEPAPHLVDQGELRGQPGTLDLLPRYRHERRSVQPALPPRRLPCLRPRECARLLEQHCNTNNNRRRDWPQATRRHRTLTSAAHTSALCVSSTVSRTAVSKSVSNLHTSVCPDLGKRCVGGGLGLPPAIRHLAVASGRQRY